MNNDARQKIASLAAAFLKAVGDLPPEEIECSFLPNEDGTLLLKGNRQALFYLGSILLEMAVNGVDGTHYHFDRTGIIDVGDNPFVLRLVDQ